MSKKVILGKTTELVMISDEKLGLELQLDDKTIAESAAGEAHLSPPLRTGP